MLDEDGQSRVVERGMKGTGCKEEKIRESVPPTESGCWVGGVTSPAK